jgi:spore germination cell wall hydrolase CwlJ-like protein
MSRKFERAGTIAVAATLLSIMLGAEGSVAAKANPARAEIAPEPAPFISSPVVQPLPAQSQPAPRETTRAPVAADIDAAPVRAGSLAKLVSAQPQPSELSRELNCLAGAVYFESKGETLAGQLAVGRVVVARSKSGRFPDSYCGVVFQRSQFSFVRGNSMPPIDKRSRHWKHAVAIAQIAHAGAWRSEAEGALFFHAAYVSPGWRLKRVARIDNHVFYR